MKRLLTAALSPILGARANAMQKDDSWSEVGARPWVFYLPNDWVYKKDADTPSPYFEAADGTKGCYIKTLEFSRADLQTESAISHHIQEIQRKSVRKGANSQWKEVLNVISESQGHVTSSLHLIDKSANYLVVSQVSVHGQLAAQLTFHDYCRENYKTSRNYADAILSSLEFRG